jgi:two-component system phosphate regulon sensor histidine kinase PhoR
MKKHRDQLYIGVSSIALLVVLFIQANWMWDTAQVKEQIFNEKANMVLAKTAEALVRDSSARGSIEKFVGRNETRTIDSLIKYYMAFYHIELSYFFEVHPGPLLANKTVKQNSSTLFAPQNCYQTCVRPGSESRGTELKLVFPEKEEFILAEMGPPFLSSVLLIIVVIVLSWRTVLSLIREKTLSEHTTDFLNNMTHEFKTPLTNIALAGKMMVKDSNITQEEKVKHYSGIILEENDKLRLQVEQVLSMTALEKGEIPLQKSEVDLHILIREAVKCISLQVENRQGELRLELNAHHAKIMGDKIHLTNSICNLVDNAIKYSHESPVVKIETSNNGPDIIIVITDNGIGIDPRFREKVFQKFFRVPTGNVHDVKGFGLGLTYVKKIIEMHGGTIELYSEVGIGTRFTITLPNA